ncbi:hypothetical protein [Lutibacter sp.]|uniref:hypothetical protein n=1 Tax=Lutibacter sp. TaxID=1925666 RepID=UPI0027328D6A|nr:hypothetical protein [Lutibacter sp.]MDP3312167.1 hypothetical protein [Lutibacter sp.]
MKKYILFLIIGLLALNCNGQKDDIKKEEVEENQKTIAKQPKGSWKVNKEFDKNGNLIRYDSI